MKFELEKEDMQAIAKEVAEMLKPLLSGRAKAEAEDVIFDVPGLAEYLKVSTQWIYERTHLNEIPFIKVGGHVRFRKSEIDRFLEQSRVPTASATPRSLRAVKIR